MQQALMLLRPRRVLLFDTCKSASIRLRYTSFSIVSTFPYYQCRPLALSARLFASQHKSTNPPAAASLPSRPPAPKPFASSKQQQANPSNHSKPQSPSSASQPQSSPTTTFTGTKGAVPHVPSSNKAVYPASLLVYHAGMPMIFFVASTKLAAILVFIVSVCFIAPQYYLDPLEPNYMAAVAAGGGALVLGLNVFAVPSVISFVHIALPAWARISTPRLHQYLKNLPPHAALDVTAMRWIWPRVSRMSVSELSIRWGSPFSYKLRREVPAEVYAARKWYHWRPTKSFLVAARSSKVKDNKAWDEILQSIQEGWAHDPRMKKPVAAASR